MFFSCLWCVFLGFDGIIWGVNGVGFELIENYILDENKELVPVDLLTWAEWFENIENRRVASTYIDDYHISTVFLGINHSWDGKELPLVYETMVFSPKGDDSYMTRYHTWNEAIFGHEVACEWVRQGAKE